MPTKPISLLLVALWLLPLWGHGQAIADSSQYRQAKLGIWCETTRFIYADNGADSLLRELGCRNWEAFKESLQENSLGEKAFFEAIEKPAIYAGYTSYQAKINKLIEEIGRKLKAAPGRQASEQRLQGVDSLQRSLHAIAANPQAYAATAMPVQVQQALPLNEEEQNRNEAAAAGNTVLEAEEEPVAEAGVPWLEIMQWLLLLGLAAAMVWMYKKNKALEWELNRRMAKRKQEVASLSVKKDTDPLPANDVASPAGLPEKEVVRLIRKEIDRLKQQQQMKMKKSAAAAPPAQQEPPLPKKEKVEESESMESPLDQKKESPAEVGVYYDKLPFKGGFHQSQLSRQPHADSIYTIEVLKEKPEEAAFWVTEDHDVQKYAMQNGLSFFEEACEFGQIEESPSRVRNLEKGALRKKGHLWQIEKKAKVSFE